MSVSSFFEQAESIRKQIKSNDKLGENLASQRADIENRMRDS